MEKFMHFISGISLRGTLSLGNTRTFLRWVIGNSRRHRPCQTHYCSSWTYFWQNASLQSIQSSEI